MNSEMGTIHKQIVKPIMNQQGKCREAKFSKSCKTISLAKVMDYHGERKVTTKR